MAWRGTRRHRFQLFVAAIVTVIQLPVVAWLCHQGHSPLPVLVAAAFSAPYLRAFQAPWSDSPRWTAVLGLGWWTICAFFDILALPARYAIHHGWSPLWTWSGVWLIGLLIATDTVLARPRLRHRTIRILGLPAALDGYRIGQLSDIHCGPHAPERKVAGWVERLNRLGLDAAVVTGDLITTGSAHVAAVARALGGLRAKDGAYVSLGNHDYFTDAEELVRQLEQSGLTVLRNQGRVIARGDSQLYLAGVDDTWSGRANMGQALEARPHATPTVLLAHDPDLFPEAENHGVELTLSGHTHGGQLAVPWVQRLTLGRLVSAFPRGLYKKGRSWLYVSSGAGTTGPPARLGAPGELTVLTLRTAK